MKLSLVIGALLLASSCINFKGTFTADKNLKFVHSTVFGNEKTKTVPAGTYRTSFKFSSDDKVKFTFNREGDDIEVKVKLPENRSFPRERGVINLPASQSGQRYDIRGSVDTRYSQSGVTRTTESCSRTVYRRSCTTVCDGGNRRSCRQVCDRIPVTIYGRQDVEFRYSYTDRSLELELTVPRSDEIVGDYNGQDRETNKVYLYQGRCY